MRTGRKALDLIVHDTEVSYLANNERQLAIERLLIRFGEALKSIPNQTLTEIESNIAWTGPKGFRDIALDCGLRTGVKHGVTLTCTSNSIVSLAR